MAFSLESFGEFLIGSIERLEHRKESLEKAAAVVEEEAKSEPGTYQSAVGPFAAWSPLADSTLEDKARSGFDVPSPLLRTGEMKNSIQHNADHNEAFIGTNDPVAKYQELGTKHIPPRSFLGGALVRKEEEVVKILGHDFLDGVFDGKKLI